MKHFYGIPHKPKSVKIKSVEQYIRFINKITSNNFYFRGESNKYPSRTASVYRRLDNDGFSNSYINFNALLLEYYKEVGSMLDDASKDNFVAFAQHHFLKTPLLDVTTNPLTALYFSVESSSENGGYVYLFDKASEIDISEFIRGHKPLDLLDQIIDFSNTELIKCLAKGIQKINSKNPKEFNILCYSLIQHCKIVYNGPFNATFTGGFDYEYFYDKFYNYINKISLVSSKSSVKVFEDLVVNSNKMKDTVFEFVSNDEYIREQYLDFSSKLYSTIDCLQGDVLRHQSEHLYPPIDNEIEEYLFILIHHLRFIKHHLAAYDFHGLPHMPIMIYEPTFLFDRMRAQNGSFFYQLGIHKTESTYLSGSVEYQEYLPQYIVQIENQEEIKRQLAAIKITRKSIYPDFDNIAIDLIEKYSELAVK